MEPVMSTSPAEPSLIDQMLAGLAGLVPAGQEGFVRAMLLALQPADAMQAALAIQIVATHYAMLDALRRAAAPGQSDSMAARQRGNAASAQRVQQAALRALAVRRGEGPPAKRSRQAAEPTTPQRPKIVLKPLPPDIEALRKRHWYELTMEERRRAYGYGAPATEGFGKATDTAPEAKPDAAQAAGVNGTATSPALGG
jgi:hypothetical protein